MMRGGGVEDGGLHDRLFRPVPCTLGLVADLHHDVELCIQSL